MAIYDSCLQIHNQANVGAVFATCYLAIVATHEVRWPIDVVPGFLHVAHWLLVPRESRAIEAQRDSVRML